VIDKPPVFHVDKAVGARVGPVPAIRDVVSMLPARQWRCRARFVRAAHGQGVALAVVRLEAALDDLEIAVVARDNLVRAFGVVLLGVPRRHHRRAPAVRAGNLAKRARALVVGLVLAERHHEPAPGVGAVCVAVRALQLVEHEFPLEHALAAESARQRTKLAVLLVEGELAHGHLVVAVRAPRRARRASRQVPVELVRFKLVAAVLALDVAGPVRGHNRVARLADERAVRAAQLMRRDRAQLHQLRAEPAVGRRRLAKFLLHLQPHAVVAVGARGARAAHGRRQHRVPGVPGRGRRRRASGTRGHCGAAQACKVRLRPRARLAPRGLGSRRELLAPAASAVPVMSVAGAVMIAAKGHRAGARRRARNDGAS
jgi:hypothetical protein